MKKATVLALSLAALVTLGAPSIPLRPTRPTR